MKKEKNRRKLLKKVVMIACLVFVFQSIPVYAATIEYTSLSENSVDEVSNNMVSSNDDDPMFEKEQSDDPQEPESKGVIEIHENANVQDRLSKKFFMRNKNFILIGDSIMHGAGNEYNSFDYYLNQEYDTRSKKYCASGSTLIPTEQFQTEGRDWIWQLVFDFRHDVKHKKVKVTKDTVILLDGGINDILMFADKDEFKVGSKYSADDGNTVLPELDKVIQYIRDIPELKEAMIIVVLPPNQGTVLGNSLIGMYNYNVKQMCKKYSDVRILELDKIMEIDEDTDDQLHPNESGYKKSIPSIVELVATHSATNDIMTIDKSKAPMNYDQRISNLVKSIEKTYEND